MDVYWSLANSLPNVVLAVAIGAERFAAVRAGERSDVQMHTNVIAHIAMLCDLSSAY